MGRPSSGTQLTEGQAKIVMLYLRGWDNQEIADELGVSKPAVTHSLRRVFEKYAVRSREELRARLSMMNRRDPEVLELPRGLGT